MVDVGVSEEYTQYIATHLIPQISDPTELIPDFEEERGRRWRRRGGRRVVGGWGRGDGGGGGGGGGGRGFGGGGGFEGGGGGGGRLQQRGRGGQPLQLSQGPLMQGGMRLGGKDASEGQVPMDTEEGVTREGATGEAPMDMGATSGDLQDHMIGFL